MSSRPADPVSSRRIFVMESGGRVYVPSGYMRSFLGRLWKDWAFDVEEGSKLAVARIEGVRYERELDAGDPGSGRSLKGWRRKLAMKYAGGETPEAVAADHAERRGRRYLDFRDGTEEVREQ